MSKPYPALCKDCKHSEPEEHSTWSLRCTNPKVNASDPWALSTAGRLGGTGCSREREGGFFSPCGKRGALWEPAADRVTGAQP